MIKNDSKKQDDNGLPSFPPIETYIDNQKKLLNLEHDTELVQHKQLLSTLSLSELESMGLCISKLVVSTIKTGLFGKLLLTLAAKNYNKKELESNPSLLERMNDKFSHHKFTPGDTIGLFEMSMDNAGVLPNLTQKPSIEGVLYQLKQHKIIIAINNNLEDENDNIDNKCYALILMTNEVTYKRYLNALDNLNKMNNDRGLQQMKHSSFLLNVLFGNEKPDNTNPYGKKIDRANEIKYKDTSINIEQKAAVNDCTKCESIYLIHGPPGTGKTKTLCEFIYQSVLKKMRILACAASNIAVDNMVERLLARGVKCCRIGHPARLLPTIINSSLDSMVYKDDHAKDLRDSKREIKNILTKITKAKDRQTKLELKRQFYSMKKELKSLERSAVMSTLNNAEVILATNSGAADKTLQKFIESLPGKAFDIVVIDECAQALEVSCLIPLMHGKKAVLAGDHQQLPPTIKSKEAEEQGLNITLFDRLMKAYGDSNSQLLRVQYRMNKLIMNWSSKEVYNNKLIADQSVAEHTLADLHEEKEIDAIKNLQEIEESKDNDSVPVIMLMDTAGCNMGENVEEGLRDRQSKFNIGEADLVLMLIKEIKLLYGNKIKNEDIGVITPYNAQVELIRKLLEKENMFNNVIESKEINIKNDKGVKVNDNIRKIEVSTVDGFQGREKEIIIISMVRSNIKKNVGFLGDYRRMNVAVTRAKRYVGLICDSETVKQDAFLKKLVEYFEANGDVRSASEFMGNKDVRFNIGSTGKDVVINDKIGVKDNQIKENKVSNKNENVNINNAKNKKKKKKKNDIKDEIEDLKTKTVDIKESNSKQGDNINKLEIAQEEILNSYYELIQEFIEEEEELIFELPSNLNSYERMKIHEFADSKKLMHESIGTGNERHIILQKMKKKIIANPSPALSKSEVQQQPKIEINAIKKENTQVKLENNQPKIEKSDMIKADGKIEQLHQVQGNNNKAVGPNTKDQKKKDKDKNKKEEEELDDDAFLNALITQNSKCHFSSNCTGNIQLLGIICKYCEYKFCTKHALAETHGCGDKAKEDARTKFKNEFNMTYNYNADIIKPLRKDDEEILRKKLAQKIDKNITNRGVKQQKKKGK